MFAMKKAVNKLNSVIILSKVRYRISPIHVHASVSAPIPC